MPLTRSYNWPIVGGAALIGSSSPRTNSFLYPASSFWISYSIPGNFIPTAANNKVPPNAEIIATQTRAAPHLSRAKYQFVLIVPTILV